MLVMYAGNVCGVIPASELVQSQKMFQHMPKGNCKGTVTNCSHNGYEFNATALLLCMQQHIHRVAC